MSAELAVYTHELRWVLDQIVTLLRSYPHVGIDWRPATGAANSAAAIATHVLSTTHVYVLGFGCGQPVERDRAAEFAVVGTDAEALMTALMDLADDLHTAITTLPAPALDHRLLPPRHLWGATTDPREISAREAIVSSIRHAALHLGELRLTRDLAALDSMPA